MAETLKIHEKKILKLNILLSEARQAKTEHMEMKILQPIFGILVVLTKNELKKTCNEQGNNFVCTSRHLQMEGIMAAKEINGFQFRLVFVLQHHNYIHPCRDLILKRRLLELNQERSTSLLKNNPV